jgi:hypothetical protein
VKNKEKPGFRWGGGMSATLRLEVFKTWSLKTWSLKKFSVLPPSLKGWEGKGAEASAQRTNARMLLLCSRLVRLGLGLVLTGTTGTSGALLEGFSLHDPLLSYGILTHFYVLQHHNYGIQHVSFRLLNIVSDDCLVGHMTKWGNVTPDISGTSIEFALGHLNIYGFAVWADTVADNLFPELYFSHN